MDVPSVERQVGIDFVESGKLVGTHEFFKSRQSEEKKTRANMLATILVASATISSLPTGDGADPFKFMAIGDWGASYTSLFGSKCGGKESPQQVADAVQMGRYASTHKVNHVMLLGDNFYESGVHGDCHNCRFQKTFESVYDASSLKDIPFYAIAGNHDHGGNVSAQIAYSKVSSRWKYPDWYYTFTENFTDPVAGKSVTVQFIMIDTVIGASGDGVYGEEQLGEFPEVPYPANAPTAAQQLAWAEMEMARSTADYLWLAGHYPVWSGCSHGNDETMNTVYKPLIEKYHLTGYMSGHDHCEEHIDEGKGPAYVLTGSGFECCYKGSNADKVPEGAIKFAYWDGDCPAGAKCPPKSKNSAFAVFTASATEMVVEYIDSAGKSLYTSPPMKPRSTTQKGVTPSAAE